MRTIRDDEEALLAVDGPLVLVVTRIAPTPESFAPFRDAIRELLASSDGHAYVLVVMRARRPRLVADVRTMMLALWREIGDRIVVAAWIGRDSFAGAIQRSVVTGLSLLAIARTPIKVVSDGRDALAWFVERDATLAEHCGRWQQAIDAAVIDP
ncbi:MAG: hypothetical protein U0168_17145 [Nannocystaceae bacterium]